MSMLKQKITLSFLLTDFWEYLIRKLVLWVPPLCKKARCTLSGTEASLGPQETVLCLDTNIPFISSSCEKGPSFAFPGGYASRCLSSNGVTSIPAWLTHCAHQVPCGSPNQPLLRDTSVARRTRLHILVHVAVLPSLLKLPLRNNLAPVKLEW